TLGCWANTTPAVALAEGWVWMVRWSAVAALTATVLEVALVRPLLVKVRVILVARLCDKLAKATRPLAAARLVAPCKVPLPAARAAVMTVLLSLVRRLPNWSSIRMAGCCAKATPAVAVVAGCVRIVSRLAAAALTVTLDEVTDPKLPPLKLRFIVSATA